MESSITFALRGAHISLDSLIKACGLALSGGQAKSMVAQGLVQVDGLLETRKTAKIRNGQTVCLPGARIQVIAQAQESAEDAVPPADL